MYMIKKLIGWGLAYFVMLALALLAVRFYLDYYQSKTLAPHDYKLVKAVSSDLAFIGQGLEVSEADPKWQWLLPDLQSLAQKTADESLFKPDPIASQVKYKRSYRIKQDIGFVFYWLHKGKPVYLFYQFLGDNGFTRVMALNTGDTSLDDLIIATYFTDEKNWPVSNLPWDETYPDDDYYPEALGFIGEEVFRRSDYFNRFPGRIASVMWERLDIRTKPYGICRLHYDNCLPLPGEFEQQLEEALDLTVHTPEKVDKYLASIKVQYGENGKFEKVISLTLFNGDFVYFEDEHGTGRTEMQGEFVLAMPVPSPSLGEGSVAFHIQESEFAQ
ncbi:hypothetical protein ACFSJ3_17060 [Corallincola platygyrae]|uniref:Uncharacterized protein n=1 Tax=Corallincola platygyrae TaxID=1193278 RepID=A0ABW4XQ84_9GAMM